jgi:hypothetical protein
MIYQVAAQKHNLKVQEQKYDCVHLFVQAAISGSEL